MTAEINPHLEGRNDKVANAPALRLFRHVSNHIQLIVVLAVAIVVLLGLWLTIVTGNILMEPEFRVGGGFLYTVLLFIMWWTMMLAMMLPSTVPAILTYGAIAGKLSMPFSGSSVVAFAGGYAAVWSVFSLGATLLHLLTEDIFHLTGMMAVTSKILGALLLIAAGLYQLTPFKQSCLRKCQMPLMYLARHWQKGLNGAFRMGFGHGLYCVGCCFVLMGLLFYGGVMELSWIIGIGIFVAAEKILPTKGWLSNVSGIALLGWGAVLFWNAAFP
jgi:predicted metal-binding membrane protein